MEMLRKNKINRKDKGRYNEHQANNNFKRQLKFVVIYKIVNL